MSKHAQSSPTATRASVGRWLFVTAVLLAGIGAGAHWHQAISRALGWWRDAGTGPSEATEHRSQLWTCGMHPQVIQDHPGDCPICHMKLVPLKGGGSPADQGRPGDAAGKQGREEESAEGRRVKYWWDPMMNPPYISDHPGKSPMGMDLVPVYEEGSATAPPGTVVVDPVIVQNMGVRVGLVKEGPLKKPLRLVGYLDEAQPNIRDINLRVSGWIRRLYASTEGMHVEAGDPLFDLYSPELQIAIEEMISARRARAASSADGTDGAEGAGSAGALYEAAARKLELLGLERAQAETLAKLDRAPELVTFTSPIAGHITEKPVVDGAAVRAGDRVLRIVDHTTLWLDARVFEKDLPFIGLGQEAAAVIASRPPPSDTVRGTVIFIHPHVDTVTRTALVRLSVPNPSMTLKPGMYATVRMDVRLSDRAVLVPREAVIDTGESQVAFVARAEGHFEPRRVRTGLACADGQVQVVEGLAPGEAVVTSGQFLLDSESRLREAVQRFLGQSELDGAAAKSRPDMIGTPGER